MTRDGMTIEEKIEWLLGRLAGRDPFLREIRKQEVKALSEVKRGPANSTHTVERKAQWFHAKYWKAAEEKTEPGPVVPYRPGGCSAPFTHKPNDSLQD